MESFPQSNIETRVSGPQEKIINLGSLMLQREIVNNFEIPSKRLGAFALMTLLAMGFAGAGKAEAQTRYGPTLGQQVKREAAEQISRSVGRAMTGVDQAHYGKIEKAGQERSDALTRLGDYEMRLDGDFKRGSISREEYLFKKNEVKKAKELVERKHRGEVSKAKTRQRIFQSVRSGIRGW